MPTLREHDKCFPRCTSYEKYKSWRETPPAVNESGPGFCTDCLPWYQKEKASMGLCDHPEVLFYLAEDGSVFGSDDPSVVHRAITL